MMQMAITRRNGDYYGDATDNHIWEITDQDGIIAELYVSTERHEIMNVWVREDHRGEGLARALYETAAREMDICHAPVAHRTVEGNAFAQALGGETAEYECHCDGCDPIDDTENED